ncbi:MAG TPA: hypothetical protein VFE26_05210 [Trebonia sp.]|nr:hypothetical protein [Trebonia sp.]
MRIANLSGRLVLITGGRAVDVAKASERRFGSHPQAIYWPAAPPSFLHPDDLADLMAGSHSR